MQALDSNLLSSTTRVDYLRLPATHLSFNMASDLSAPSSQHEVVCESVESLRVQIKETEDKWNDELKRLEAAREDKEELEQILQILQTLVEYERAATLKMEAMLKETREAFGSPDGASRPTLEVYDLSRSTGSSSSGNSSPLEFDLVYNPYATLKVPIEPSSVSSPPSLPGAGDQELAVPSLLPTLVKPTSKPKRSPNSNWKSRITSILISHNNHSRTNPPSSPLSLSSTTPFFDDADSHNAKPKRAAKYPKRSLQDSENPGATSWRRTMGSAGSKFANRANRDINRKNPRELASILQD